jgi:hypothetical protein
MGDSTLAGTDWDEGEEEGDEDEDDAEENSESDTSDMTESDPGADEELDAFGKAGPRTTVTISRRNKPKTTNVVTDHTIPTTASAARADLQQKKFRSKSAPPTIPSTRATTFEKRQKNSAPSSKFSSKYIEDGS